MKSWKIALVTTLLAGSAMGIGAANPAAFVTNPAQRRSIASIENLDNGRFYMMDYSADYKLDALLDKSVGDIDGMLQFIQTDLLPGGNVAKGNIDAGCSAFAGRTDDGKPIYGRNFDYKMDMTAVLIRTAPKGGYRSIGMADAGWIGYGIGSLDDGKTDISAAVGMPYLIMDGLNEKGLAVSVLKLDGAPTRQNTGKKKITTTAALRLMLDKAADVEEALALLRQYDMQSSMDDANFHFLLSDASAETWCWSTPSTP